MLGGAGSNSGLGNQAIFANGNRDTSNSFSLNGVDTNNLFNGNSTSQVGENRFVLNIGENFGAGGAIQTSTSVYGAIGQALPTPPPETIQEVSVNAAMYDATQGAHSGAHISVITKSGTNEMHGMLYEDFQNSVMNAAPFFYNALAGHHHQGSVPDPQPVRRQRRRTDQEEQAVLFPGVPGCADRGCGGCDQGRERADRADQRPQPAGHRKHDPVELRQDHYHFADQSGGAAMLQATLPNGQYLFPSAQITNSTTALALGYDAVVQGAERPVQRESGHCQRGLQRERHGSPDREILLSEQIPPPTRSGRWAHCWVFRSNFCRKPGGVDQQHRDPESHPDVAAARRIHASAGLFADRTAILAERRSA